MNSPTLRISSKEEHFQNVFKCVFNVENLPRQSKFLMDYFKTLVLTKYKRKLKFMSELEYLALHSNLKWTLANKRWCHKTVSQQLFQLHASLGKLGVKNIMKLK